MSWELIPYKSLHTRCIPLVYPLYTRCIPLNTLVHSLYTLVYPCTPFYTLYTQVYPCIPMYTRIYPCIPPIWSWFQIRSSIYETFHISLHIWSLFDRSSNLLWYCASVLRWLMAMIYIPLFGWFFVIGSLSTITPCAPLFLFWCRPRGSETAWHVKKGQEIAVKEMDHEISVNIEVEERPSTSLNIYGSPVAPRGRRNEEQVEATSQAVPLTNVNRVVSPVVLFHVYLRQKPFFLLITVYSRKYFVPHRPVTVRIRAAAKRLLKPRIPFHKPKCPTFDGTENGGFHTSHAQGIMIGRDPLREFIPLKYSWLGNVLRYAEWSFSGDI